MQGEIKKALPAVITPERFTRIVLSALSTNSKLAQTTPQSFLDNMEKSREFIMEASGCHYVDNIFRFPTGSRGEKSYDRILDFMHKKGYKAFDWTTEFHDYYYHSAEGCLGYFKKFLDLNYTSRSQDCAVVLFHPKEWSAEALPEALDYMIEKGYTFATITEDTAEYNFYRRYPE